MIKKIFDIVKLYFLGPSGPVKKDITNTAIAQNITDCLINSIDKESVGTSIIFNTCFIIFLHPDTYAERAPTFHAVFDEVTKNMEEEIKHRIKKKGKKVVVVSPGWEIKFFAAEFFKTKSINIHDMIVMGMPAERKKTDFKTSAKATQTTIIPGRKTTTAQLDIDWAQFKHLVIKDEGWYTKPFGFVNPPSESKLFNGRQKTHHAVNPTQMAPFALITSQKDNGEPPEDFEMMVTEIVIARMENENKHNSNYFLISSPFVSNPHARIRFNSDRRIFEIASFSQYGTTVNEQPITQSQAETPYWFNLPASSKIILNKRVTLKFNGKA